MVDRERFDSAARIELDGLVQYTFPHTKNVPGFHIAYRAVSLVGVFLALPDSTKRELLWLLNLYAPEPEADDAPPIYVVEARLPDADEEPPPMNVDPEGE